MLAARPSAAACALAADVERLAALQFGLDQLGPGFQHHGQVSVVAGGMFDQGHIDGVFAFVFVDGQFDKAFRAAIAVAVIVFDHVAAHRIVGGILVGFLERGGNHVAMRISVVGKLFGDLLAHQFSGVFGMRGKRLRVAVQMERFMLGLGELRIGDPAQRVHAFDDVLLALLGARGIDKGIVGRWPLG